MPDNKPTPQDSDAHRTATGDRRRSRRAPLTPAHTAEESDGDEVGIKLRPTVIAITIMVIALLILTAIGI